MFDLQYCSRFYSFDKHLAGFLIIEALEIGNPFVFYCKLEVVFNTILINHVHLKTSGNDKGIKSAYIALLQQESFTFKSPLFKNLLRSHYRLVCKWKNGTEEIDQHPKGMFILTAG